MKRKCLAYTRITVTPHTSSMPIGISAVQPSRANASFKGIILLTGDETGFARITAASEGMSGENLTTYANTSLNMDHLNYKDCIATRSTDSPITDSAATSAAMSTGCKMKNNVIGRDAISICPKKKGNNPAATAWRANEVPRTTMDMPVTAIRPRAGKITNGVKDCPEIFGIMKIVRRR
jgi:alkaline phosphatase